MSENFPSSFQPEDTPEAPREGSFSERKKELALHVGELHDQYITRIQRLLDEWQKIMDRPEYKAHPSRIGGDRKDFMRPKDYERYKEIHDEEEKYDMRVLKRLDETVKLFSEDPNVEWYLKPSGDLGSLALTNSRHYRADIGNSYALEVSYYNYPDDMGTVHMPETYTESYSAKFIGKKNVSKGILKKKKEEVDFPPVYLKAEFSTKGELEPYAALKVFDEETQKRMQSDVVSLGKRLREKLG